MTRRRGAGERGAISVEFAVLLPVLMLLLATVVAGARVWWARATVDQLASSAARQASISRTAGEASSSAAQLVRRDAHSSGLTCSGSDPNLDLDVSGFSIPVGQPASVRAKVTCVVSLSDVTLPFVAGSIKVDADATSTLDRYRGRK